MKYYFLIAATALVMTSCNRKELADSNHANDSLAAVVNEREATLNEFINSFNEVEANLDSVAAKQHIIVQNADNHTEMKPTQKTRINEEIASINALMEQNRAKIVELDQKLKKSGNTNARLTKTIETLN